MYMDNELGRKQIGQVSDRTMQIEISVTRKNRQMSIKVAQKLFH